MEPRQHKKLAKENEIFKKNKTNMNNVINYLKKSLLYYEKKMMIKENKFA